MSEPNPPRDLTAERAAAERLVNEIYGTASGRCMGPIWEEYVMATVQLIRQTRQEALREARDAVGNEMLEETPANEPDEAYNRAIDHALKALDRLASEGG